MKDANWEVEIGLHIITRLEIEKADGNNIFIYPYPNSPATCNDIKEAEKVLGFSFDNDYADFLLHANGWDSFSFCDRADLYGTADYHGSGRYLKAVRALAQLERNGLLREASLALDDVFPICAGFEIPIVYAMRKRPIVGRPRIFCFTDEMDEDYENFTQFFRVVRDDEMDILESIRDDNVTGRTER